MRCTEYKLALTIRFSCYCFTAWDARAEDPRHIRVSSEAPRGITAIRIPAVILPQVPAMHTYVQQCILLYRID